MANLIAKLARKSDLNPGSGSFDSELSQLSLCGGCGGAGSSFGLSPPTQTGPGNAQLALMKPPNVLISVGPLRSRNTSASPGGEAATYGYDEQPLQEEQDWDRMGRRRGQLSC